MQIDTCTCEKNFQYTITHYHLYYVFTHWWQNNLVNLGCNFKTEKLNCFMNEEQLQFFSLPIDLTDN